MRSVCMGSFYLSSIEEQKCSIVFLLLSSEELQKIHNAENTHQYQHAFYLLPGQVIGEHYYYHPKLLVSSAYKTKLTQFKRAFKTAYPTCQYYISKCRRNNIVFLSTGVSFVNMLDVFEKGFLSVKWEQFECDLQLEKYLPKFKDWRHNSVARLSQSTHSFSLVKLSDVYDIEGQLCQPPQVGTQYHYVLPITHIKKDMLHGLHEVKLKLIFKRLFSEAYFEMLASQSYPVKQGQTACYSVSVALVGLGTIDMPNFLSILFINGMRSILKSHPGLVSIEHSRGIAVYGHHRMIVSVLQLLRSQLLTNPEYSCDQVTAYEGKVCPVENDYTFRFIGELYNTISNSKVKDLVFQLTAGKIYVRISMASLKETVNIGAIYQQELSNRVFRIIIAYLDTKDRFIVTNNASLIGNAIAKITEFVNKNASIFEVTYDSYSRPYLILKKIEGVFSLATALRLQSTFSFKIEGCSDMEEKWNWDLREYAFFYDKYKMFVESMSIPIFMSHMSSMPIMPILQDLPSPNVDELHSFLFPPAESRRESKRKRESDITSFQPRGGAVKRMRPEHIAKHLQLYEHEDAERICYRHTLRQSSSEYLNSRIQQLEGAGVNDYRMHELRKEYSDRQQGHSLQLPSFSSDVPPISDVLDVHITHPDYQQNVERMIAEQCPEHWKRYKYSCEPYLEVRPSTIEGAGDGLFVVAKDHDVVIRDVYIPYLGIKRPCENADSNLQNPKLTHIIGYGTGGAITRGGSVIEHIDGDRRPQAYFANHMHKDGPYFSLTEYLREKQLKGIYIPNFPGLAVPKGQCVEIFTNYGKAAKTHHGIVDSKVPVPTELFHAYEPDVQDAITMRPLY